MESLEKSLEEIIHRGKKVEELIVQERPELLEVFFTYQNEAVSARMLIQKSLIHLAPDAKLLEVGGGVLALAIQLAKEGFEVTSVEPIGDGFSDIFWIMERYLIIAQEEKIRFALISDPIEKCLFDTKFDFIFSINVMEHLKNPYEVIAQLANSLEDFGLYRFICPNYDFPYEPHFAKWIWLRKRGAFYLRKSRVNHSTDLYSSLNFITAKRLMKRTKDMNVKLTFEKNALFDLMMRATKDSSLRGRHKSIGFIADFAKVTGLIYLTKFVPTMIQPVIDVNVNLKNKKKVSHL